MIIRISGFKTEYYKKYSLFAILSAVVLWAVAFIFKSNPYLLLLEVKDIVIAYIPSVLGFTIAGYTLVVGFIQANMLERISERLDDSPYSLYQRISSMLALNLVIQGVALVGAFVIHFAVYFDNELKLHQHFSPLVCQITNWVGLIIICLTLTYPLFLIIQMIINIFGFSQLHHYFVNRDKIQQAAAPQPPVPPQAPTTNQSGDTTKPPTA